MKSKFIAYILLFCMGPLGAHKFYLKKIGMGIAYLCSGGLFGIGLLVDLFTLGSQVDMYNAENKLLPPTQQQHNIVVNVNTPAGIVPEVRISPEKQILALADQHNLLTVRHIVAITNLYIDQAENALKRLVASGIAKEQIAEDGKIIYDFS